VHPPEVAHSHPPPDDPAHRRSESLEVEVTQRQGR